MHVDYRRCPECGDACVVLFDAASGEETCACLSARCGYGYYSRRKPDAPCADGPWAGSCCQGFLNVPEKPEVHAFPLINSRLENGNARYCE